MSKKNKSKLVVCMSDIHVPNDDPKTLDAVFRCIKDIKPTEVILNGDIADFESISRFEKPLEVQAALDTELACLYTFFGRLRKVAPHSYIHYVKGNHEDRLDKYLSKNAKELQGLESLKLENLLKLGDFDIKYTPERWLIRDNILYSHLDKYSPNPGASAKAIGLKHVMDVIHGHTHTSCHAKMNKYTFIEEGCLCLQQQSYVKEPSHFRQAFVVVHIQGQHKHYQLVNIEKEGFYYGNKFYKR